MKLARAICRSDGLPLSAVPNLVYRQAGRLVRNARTYCATTANLGALDLVNMDFLAHAGEYAETLYGLTQSVHSDNTAPYRGHWLTIGRGCNYQCSFCVGCALSHQTIAGRKVEFKTFQDRYHYCQETTALRKDVGLSAWRVFNRRSKPPYTLERMAMMWDVLANSLPANCSRVPRGW